MSLDVLIFAGGRISGLFARAAGTRIKALVPIEGEPLVCRVAANLRRVAGVERVCVVGPEAVRDVLKEPILWQQEGSTAIDNVRLGLDRLDRLAREAGGPPASPRRVLLCGTDVPALTPDAVEDFLRRAPEEADICQPVVRKEDFLAAFPGDLGIYVRLAEGAFTGGSAFLVRPEPLLAGLPLVEALFRRRKSQLAMVRTLGMGLVWKLVRGRLTIPELEQRLSELTGCRVRAVRNSRPELAFDLDNLMDLRYFERRLAGRERR